MAKERDIAHRFMNNPRIANKIVDDLEQRLQKKEEEECTGISLDEIDQVVIYGANTNGGETE